MHCTDLHLELNKKIFIDDISIFDQLPSKPSSQSLRLVGQSDGKSHRLSQISKRYSHDELLLHPQLGVSSSPCGLLDDTLCSTSDSLGTHRHWKIPKVR